MTKLKLKERIQYISVFCLSALMLFGSAKKFIKDTNLDLTKTTIVKGHIIKSYLTTRRTGGKIKRNMPIFAFNLDNLSQTLGAYRPSHNYSKLINNLQPGDFVTVYYRHNKYNDINIDVFQIEKGREIILDYETYNINHTNGAILIGVIGIVFLCWGIWLIRKRI